MMLLTLVSCKSQQDKTNSKIAGECLPYFEYDDVDHFSIKIEEDSVWSLKEREVKSVSEKKLLDLLQDDLHDISDTVMLMDLPGMGFEKKKIPREKFSQLDQLFCERSHEEISASTCIPIYRDILLFKNHNRITGFARLCFDCDQSNLIGSNRDTKTFGQAGEFAALSRMLE